MEITNVNNLLKDVKREINFKSQLPSSDINWNKFGINELKIIKTPFLNGLP